MLRAMAPLAFSRLAAELPFWLTMGVWAVGERILDFRSIRSGAWRSRQDRGSSVGLVVTMVVGLLAAIAIADWRRLELPEPWIWLILGLVIAWAGLLLRLWAVLTLGRSFTTAVVVRSDQRVVTTGPYKLVRHPSYLGLLILFLGFGLALGNPLSPLVLVVLPAIGLIRRISVEERALRGELGDEYAGYCDGRSRLVPGIW